MATHTVAVQPKPGVLDSIRNLFKITELVILLIVVVLLIVGGIINPRFLSIDNVKIMTRDTAILAIVAIGVGFTILTAGIDLSVGSIVGLIGGLSANLIRMREMPIFSALMICFGLAALMGLLHGFLVTKIKVQPFVVTLCGLFIYRGLARFILQDVTQGYGNAFQALKFLAHGRIPSALWPLNQAPQFIQEWSLPMPFVILVVVGILLGVFLNHTVFGLGVIGCSADTGQKN